MRITTGLLTLWILSACVDDGTAPAPMGPGPDSLSAPCRYHPLDSAFKDSLAGDFLPWREGNEWVYSINWNSGGTNSIQTYGEALSGTESFRLVRAHCVESEMQFLFERKKDLDVKEQTRKGDTAYHDSGVDTTLCSDTGNEARCVDFFRDLSSGGSPQLRHYVSKAELSDGRDPFGGQTDKGTFVDGGFVFRRGVGFVEHKNHYFSGATCCASWGGDTTRLLSFNGRAVVYPAAQLTNSSLKVGFAR